MKTHDRVIIRDLDLLCAAERSLTAGHGDVLAKDPLPVVKDAGHLFYGIRPAGVVQQQRAVDRLLRHAAEQIGFPDVLDDIERRGSILRGSCQNQLAIVTV